MKYDPEYILVKFNQMSSRLSTDVDALKQFVMDHFEREGSDVIEWLPTDYRDAPSFLQKVKDTRYRAWAQKVHALWRILGRKPSPSVYAHPMRHSLIGTRHPFIVPGGRFREVYYWDTYWVIKGLLTSEMLNTSLAMADSLVGLIDQFGVLPNGNRRYYLRASQPPFLPQMIELLFDYITHNHSASPGQSWHDARMLRHSHSHSGSFEAAYSLSCVDPIPDRALRMLRSSLPALDREYEHFMKLGEHAVQIKGPNGTTHVLNRFFVRSNRPRPESFREDEATAGIARSPEERERMYTDLASGGEAGWDYSSRWFADRKTLSTILTTQVIPVDLNAVLCRNERTLSFLHSVLGNKAKADFYAQALRRRIVAMRQLLWDTKLSQWTDLRLNEKVRNSTAGVLSNFAPLWAGCQHADVNFTAVLQALRESQLIWPGGLATTAPRFFVGQQWDFPNAWAPLQDLTIEALLMMPNGIGRPLAMKLISTWVASNYIAFQKQGHMYEKYDARELGSGGGGGEYQLQVGFGWTNGVALSLLERFGDQLAPPSTSLANAHDRDKDPFDLMSERLA